MVMSKMRLVCVAGGGGGGGKEGACGGWGEKVIESEFVCHVMFGHPLNNTAIEAIAMT